ncbi:hypothetical protein D9611_004971 [Ephemerocybe angulata]|uniref:Hydrophobin n=1 Tax=Ephemerocybe angulata TaxID=980116 RepID=A0A8H5B2V1_9AGAR|nr:hypothetical protein D9611_004971 [Tulosesus angulatus]
MFFRISAVTIAVALAIPMVLASPAGLSARTDSCSTGSLECCKDMTSGTSAPATAIAKLLGITGSLGKFVGFTCSPINVPGAGGTHCTQQVVCCNNNSFNGVIALGCMPFNAGI